MRLVRLELSGFKSFAKATVLEFPHAISAVVGPNGSGKSNVADAVRWVLGEQSIKSLRGRRGEDLIFSGTPASPRLSRARVNLVFDNSRREFGLEFDEVQIGRRVFRDGVNEYLLNGSEVRLKDVIELLAKVGFGSSQHHIISQGEVDRILYASPKERREMIEDALGLKIFHLKRAEALRKLERTEENIRQVDGLRKEIQPHLKFLKAQAEKFEVASKLREDLKTLLEEYLSKKAAALSESQRELLEKKSKPGTSLKKIDGEIRRLREKIEKSESAESGDRTEDQTLEERLRKIRESQMATLREVGKMEGMIALEEKAQSETSEAVISKSEVEKVLKDVSGKLETLATENSLEKIKRSLAELRQAVLNFLKNLGGWESARTENLAKHREELGRLKARHETLRKEGEELSRSYEEKISRARRESDQTRREEKRVYQLELEAAQLKDDLRSLELEGEKLKLGQEEYARELEEARPYLVEKLKPTKPFSSPEEGGELRKRIERIKIKLEEAGGIDPAVLKEYKEISSRDDFLAKELSDLAESKEKLEEVMKELEDRIEKDFKEGILKINEEFQKFFQTMFGGGEASLKIIEKKLKLKKEDEAEEIEGVEEGIDINVDLPRKRIKSLDMLSGGERALTSIALLFAMSAVHPPPFLVLDETDAALDEANSERYAKMLEDLSKTTQLILITHNRTTMKCAGILYGVTMGSDGISKLLSIKFEEAGALVS